MRFPLAVSAAAVVAIAIAACSGGQQPAYTPPPPSGGVASPGALALTGYGQSQSTGTASGITGTLTYVGGTGTVTAASSATAPAGTTTVSPVDRIRVEATTSPTSPNVYYVTISSTAGATLLGLPQVSLTLATAAVGTFQEAQFSSGTWTNVSGATATTNSAGTAVSFPATKKTVTIAAGGSIYLAFYQGTYPQPTPVGQIANNVLADPGFESGTFGAIGAPITSTGWTQCTVTQSAPSPVPTAVPNRAYSTFTPIPNTTPGAVIDTAGTSVAVSTSTAPPVPTQSTVPVNSGTHAAVFGGVFTTYALDNYKYNGLCQTVTVPNNPGMQMALFANGTDSKSYVNFEVDALNANDQYIGNIYEDPNPTGSPAANAGNTAYQTVTVPQSSLTPYVGQTINLFIGLWINDGGSSKYSEYYFVDDVNLTGTP
jgi:hypothetical protein